MIKNITGTGISRKNIRKMRPHPGATSIDICHYIKPALCQKPDVVIVHCRRNDIPNNINTVKKIKKLVKEIEQSNHENIPQVVISSIIKGMIKIIMKKLKALMINFNDFVQVRVCLLLITTISINRV